MATKAQEVSKRKPPKKQLSERIEELKKALGDDPKTVLFERRALHPKDDESPVVATLSYEDGDRIGAQGATTEEAIDALEDKIAGWPKKS